MSQQASVLEQSEIADDAFSTRFSPEFPRSTLYTVTVNGVTVDVLSTDPADLACFCIDGPAQIEVRLPEPVPKAVVRPVSRGIEAAVEGSAIRFTMERPANVWVDIEGRKHLYLFASLPDADIPSRDDPHVRYFEGGRIHEVGEVNLGSGDTLYIEEGAVVRGCVRAKDASGVTIRGRGLIDGTYKREQRKWREVLLENCADVLVEGVAIVNPRSWNLVFTNCERVRVDGVREVGQGLGTDGIDIVGCRHVLIENTFQRTGDDSIAVKSWGPDVYDILVRGCTFYQHGGGGPMEIGHELRCDTVRDVTFRDCDVLGAHGHSPVMSIHNAEHATVTGILYENIRVEHYYARLIDIRIRDSMWSRETQRGQVRGVVFRDIKVTNSQYNKGYSISLIGGLDAEHKVRDVLIENMTIDGVRVTEPNQMDLYVKEAEGVVIR